MGFRSPTLDLNRCMYHYCHQQCQDSYHQEYHYQYTFSYLFLRSIVYFITTWLCIYFCCTNIEIFTFIFAQVLPTWFLSRVSWNSNIIYLLGWIFPFFFHNIAVSDVMIPWFCSLQGVKSNLFSVDFFSSVIILLLTKSKNKRIITDWKKINRKKVGFYTLQTAKSWKSRRPRL